MLISFPLSILQYSEFLGNPIVPMQGLRLTAYNEGEEIGVAGYPIAQLGVVNNQLSADGLIYRIGRGPVSASYTANISAVMQQIPLIEVNFLFFTGNSGGPVFLAYT